MSGQKRPLGWVPTKVSSMREMNAIAERKSKQELILLRAGEDQLLGPKFAGKAEK